MASRVASFPGAIPVPTGAGRASAPAAPSTLAGHPSLTRTGGGGARACVRAQARKSKESSATTKRALRRYREQPAENVWGSPAQERSLGSREEVPGAADPGPAALPALAGESGTTFSVLPARL